MHDYRNSFSNYYVRDAKIEDFNVLVDRKSFFDLPVKNKEAYKKIIEMGNSNDYIRLVIYQILLISKKHYKSIAIDLSKQTKLKDPQQINFIGKLSNILGATMFFIIEKFEETFNFSQNSVTII